MEGCGLFTVNASVCPENVTSLRVGGGGAVHETTLELVVELYLISALCLVGLFGNAVTVIVLRKDKERREALLLLQALAVADGLYLLVALLRYPLKYLLPQYDYIIMQPVVFPMLKVFQTVCVWMMVLVTIDRYIYVCKPLRAQVLFNARTRRYFAGAVFAGGVLYNLVLFFDSCIMQFHNPCANHTLTRMVIRPSFHNDWYYDVYKHGTYVILIYLLPLSVLAVLNCLLVRAIKHSTRRHRDLTPGGGGGEHNENNATLVLINIVFVFIACETPELLLRVFLIVQRKAQISLYGAGLMRFTTVSELLMVVNSSINFFIYFAFGRRFRRVMRETFVVKFTTSGTVLTPESVPLHRQPLNIARINHLLHNHVNHVKTNTSPGHHANNVIGYHGNNPRFKPVYYPGKYNTHSPKPEADTNEPPDCNHGDGQAAGNQAANNISNQVAKQNGGHSNCVKTSDQPQSNENNCNQVNHG